MSHQRVYSPDTCEPFDVTPSKASELVLQKGWTRTPWTQVEPAPEPEVVTESVRGRGRRRRAMEEAPEPEVEDTVEEDDVPADEPWQS